MVWLASACPLVLDWESLVHEASPDFPGQVRGFLGPPEVSSILFLQQTCCLPFQAVCLEGAGVTTTCRWPELQASTHQVLTKYSLN